LLSGAAIPGRACEVTDQGTSRFELGAASGDLGERGAVVLGEVAGRGEDPAGHLLGWRGCGDGGVAAQPAGEPAQGAQAAPVAAVAQFLVQPFGAADSLVPSLPQVGLVRAEQARPGQAGAADQLIGGRAGTPPSPSMPTFRCISPRSFAVGARHGREHQQAHPGYFPKGTEITGDMNYLWMVADSLNDRPVLYSDSESQAKCSRS
jgi:hypothetical protein